MPVRLSLTARLAFILSNMSHEGQETRARPILTPAANRPRLILGKQLKQEVSSVFFRALVLTLLIAGAAAAQTPSIHSMILGDQTWGIGDYVQLTHAADGRIVQAAMSPDGKHVVFLATTADKMKLCLVPSTGGSVATLASSPRWSAAGVASSPKGALIIYDSQLAWSRDSKLVAFCGVKLEGTAKAPMNREVVVVVDTKGNRKACFTFPKGYASGMAAIFSPDSRKLVAPLGGLNEPSVSLAVYDLKSNSCKMLATKTFHAFDRWSPDSKAIQYWSLAGQPDGSSNYDLHRINLSDGKDEVVQSAKRRAYTSPDGLLRAYPDESGIIVEDKAGKTRTLVSFKWPGLGRWAPNSKMLLYYIPTTISDQLNKRSRDVVALWLANMDSHKLNTMCVAFDVDNSIKPNWSADSSKIAYVSLGRLYVAALAQCPALPFEKLAAGLPLGEADMKTVVKRNAEQISAAVSQFAMDMRRLPNNADELYAWMGKDLFFKPGTDTLIFTYHVKPLTGTDSVSADTLLGTLDAGYGWKVDIYPAGRVVTVLEDRSQGEVK